MIVVYSLVHCVSDKRPESNYQPSADSLVVSPVIPSSVLWYWSQWVYGVTMDTDQPLPV